MPTKQPENTAHKFILEVNRQEVATADTLEELASVAPSHSEPIIFAVREICPRRVTDLNNGSVRSAATGTPSVTDLKEEIMRVTHQSYLACACRHASWSE